MNESTLPMMIEWRGEPWPIMQGALESLLARCNQGALPESAAAAVRGGELSGRYGVRLEGATAFVSIQGPLMRTVPRVLDYFRAVWGIAMTGYDEIREDLAAAAADEAVERIVIEMDSPGGMTTGLTAAVEAVAAARAVKPVLTHIEGMGASAAYAIASQSTRITADPDAIVGSIGTYWAMLDTSEAYAKVGLRMVVIRSGEHKGVGLPGTEITEDQQAALQAVVDGLTANFITAVSAGRAMPAAAVRKLADGRVWVAADAKSVGLIDAVGTMDTDTALAEGRPAGGTHQQESETMDKTETPAADQLQAAEERGRAAGMKAAIGALMEMKAAFPTDLAFAVAQVEAGRTVIEAKAAYADVLTARQAELTAENAKLKGELEAKATATPRTDGAEPVANLGEGGEQTALGFRERAKAMAAEEKISISAAQKRLAHEEPELYAAYRNSLDK